MRYIVELLGYSVRDDEYVYIEELRDFGTDFKGAKAYAEDLAFNHINEVRHEVIRRSKTLLPFLVDVNSVVNGVGVPIFGYVYDGESVEKVTL